MNRIKFLRNKLGYSQEVLSEKIGVSKGLIALYENGHRKPSLEVLIKLAKVFDVSIDYLLCLTDIPGKIQNSDNNIEYYMCPVYDNTALENNLSFKNPIGRIPVDKKLIKISSSDEFLFFKTPDDSMDFIIDKDSYAFIHINCSVDNNQIALICVDKRFLLRKIFIKNNNIIIVPISSNNHFSIEIFKVKDVKIIGLYEGKLEI